MKTNKIITILSVTAMFGLFKIHEVKGADYSRSVTSGATHGTNTRWWEDAATDWKIGGVPASSLPGASDNVTLTGTGTGAKTFRVTTDQTVNNLTTNTQDVRLTSGTGSNNTITVNNKFEVQATSLLFYGASASDSLSLFAKDFETTASVTLTLGFTSMSGGYVDKFKISNTSTNNGIILIYKKINELSFGALKNEGTISFQTATDYTDSDRVMVVNSLESSDGKGVIKSDANSNLKLQILGGNGTGKIYNGTIEDSSVSGKTTSVVKEGSGTQIFAKDLTYTGGTTISGGTLGLGNGGASGSVIGDIQNNGTLTFNRSDAYTTGNLISGTGAVRQEGTGILSLTANNTYTGTTSVVNGDLSIGNGGSSGLAGNGGGISIAGGRTLILNRSDDFSLNNAITGNSTTALTKLGAGTAVLTTSSSSFNGSILVSAGTLNVGGGVSGASLGSGKITNNATLVFERSSGSNVANVIEGNGTLIFRGTSKVNITNDNTAYAGNIRIESGGRVQFGNSSTTGMLAGAIANDGELLISRSNAYTLDNAISGTGQLTHSGTGVTSVTYANAYTGGTTINSGTVLANNITGSALGTGSVTVKNGAILGGSGTIALGTGKNITVESGGLLASGAESSGFINLTLDAGVTMNSGSAFAFKLGSGNQSDSLSFINYTGTLALTNNAVNVTGIQEGSYLLFNFDSSITGLGATGLTFGTGFDGFESVSSFRYENSAIYLDVIPEPNAFLLIVLGLGLCGFTHRQRKGAI